MNLEEAFDLACPDATEAVDWYVTLMRRVQRYGGPEEGGWWHDNTIIVKYARYPTRDHAEAAMRRIEALARQMTAEAMAEHGDKCLREMEWLDAHGLEPEFLGEVDGPDEFYVLMTEGLPEEDRSRPRYE